LLSQVSPDGQVPVTAPATAISPGQTAWALNIHLVADVASGITPKAIKTGPHCRSGLARHV